MLVARSPSFRSQRARSILRRTIVWCLLSGLAWPVVSDTQPAFSAPLSLDSSQLARSVTPRASSAPLSLDSSLALVSRYNNNLFLSESDPVGGFSTMVAPRVDLQFDQRLVQGQLRYLAAAEWYRQRSELNRFRQQGEFEVSLAGVRRWIRHLDLQLRGSYIRRAGELPGTSLGGQQVFRGGVIFPATTESTEWRGSISADYAWSRRLESRLEYRYVATYFDEIDSNIATTATTYDSIVHDARLVLSYRQSPRTTLTLAPGWSVTRVVPSGTDFTSTTVTRTRVRLTAGAEYSAVSTLRVRGEVGVMVIEDDQTRLALNLNLAQAWKNIQFRVRGRQDSGIGGGVTDTVSITRSLTADASRPLGRYTEARADVGLIGNLSAPVLATDPTIRVVTFRAGAGIGHDLTRWLTVRLDYILLTQRSSGTTVGGQRHLVVVTLLATGPQWQSSP